MEPDVPDDIDRASQLPLMDAAFLLWMRRHALDRAENPVPPNPDARSELHKPAVFRQMVQAAMASIVFDRANAHHGATFRRLKQAHPNERDKALQQAVKLAVKLDTDSTRNFTYDVAKNLDPVTRAVDLTRRENPGFSDSTYRELDHHLRFVMR